MVYTARLGRIAFCLLALLGFAVLACGDDGDDGVRQVAYRSGLGTLSVSGDATYEAELRQALSDGGARWDEGKDQHAFEVSLPSSDGRGLFRLSAAIKGPGTYNHFGADGDDFIGLGYIAACAVGQPCSPYNFDSRDGGRCSLVVRAVDDAAAEGSVECSGLKGQCLSCPPASPSTAVDLKASFRLYDGQAGAALTEGDFGGRPGRPRPPNALESSPGGPVPTSFGRVSGALEVSGGRTMAQGLNRGAGSLLRPSGDALDFLSLSLRNADSSVAVQLDVEVDGPATYRGVNGMQVVFGPGCDGIISDSCAWYSSGFYRSTCEVTIAEASASEVRGSVDCRGVGANCDGEAPVRAADGACLTGRLQAPVDIRASFSLDQPLAPR